jgi:hypothetical protein
MPAGLDAECVFMRVRFRLSKSHALSSDSHLAVLLLLALTIFMRSTRCCLRPLDLNSAAVGHDFV